jgi:predicted Zn-dependent protease
MNNAADLMAERGERLDEAFQLAQKAYSLRPGDPVIAGTLGIIQYRRGQYDEAIRSLETAASDSPSAQVKYHLAMAYLEAGRQQSANKLLRSLSQDAAAGPERELARQALIKLQ